MEILFKGKRKDNGEWVYGDLLQDKNGTKWIRGKYEDSVRVIDEYQVDPKTVVQFIGKCDVDGNKIFNEDK